MPATGIKSIQIKMIIWKRLFNSLFFIEFLGKPQSCVLPIQWFCRAGGLLTIHHSPFSPSLPQCPPFGKKDSLKVCCYLPLFTWRSEQVFIFSRNICCFTLPLWQRTTSSGSARLLKRSVFHPAQEISVW